MSVRFILGRAGTGKTRYILQQLQRLHLEDPLGPPVYWLLPKQATFQAERTLTALLGAFSRIRVVSFDLLGRDILTYCGDVGIPEVTAIGRRMVIGLLLRKHQKQLKFYAASAHRAGLASELDSTFGEFERAGLDVAALDTLARETDTDDPAGPALVDKLHDIHLLLQAYSAYIGQHRLDPQRRLTLIMQRVAECSLLHEAVLFVDDFYDFTAYERSLLTALAGVVRQTSIALLADPASPAVSNPSIEVEDLSLFHRTERTYRSMMAALRARGVRVEPRLELTEGHRFSAESLHHVERHFYRGGPAQPETPAVRFIDAPDARAEVDAVAREIRSLAATGTRYRNITVLVRHLGDYQQIVDASFSEHCVPYFADHRRSAGHHPLLQMVRACLLICRDRWPHEAVMTLVKSGLSGLVDTEADELENYVLRHRIRGQKWTSSEPWSFRREMTLPEIHADGSIAADTSVAADGSASAASPHLTETGGVDAMRRQLVGGLTPLLAIQQTRSTATTAREWATALFAALDAFGVRGRLARWMRAAEALNDLEQRGEHEQVWSEFCDLLQHLVELIGDEPISIADFISVLESGLESFDLALTPPKVDQVLVGQVDRTRTTGAEAVFVLGMIEGGFPSVTSEKCVLSDTERKSLRQRQIDLDPDSERRLLDERFLAYLAFTRASSRLILTRPMSTSNGRSTSPSGYWVELQRLFDGALVTHARRAADGRTVAIGTPRQLVSALMKWVRAPASPDENPQWAALYQWLAQRSTNDDSLGLLVKRAWPALRYRNDSHLESELARALFQMPLEATATQLETMAACPFRHFARFGLGLGSRAETEVTGIDLSNAYHDVLENLVNDTLAAHQDWCDLPPEQTRELIRIHAREIGRRLRGELMLSNARNRYMLDYIERTLERTLLAMTEMHRRGEYRPEYAGVRFGKNAQLPGLVVPTPGGNELHLRGRIDRIDKHRKGSAFVVIDYKLTAGPLRLDQIYYGLSLQLLTYLLVVRAGGEALAGKQLKPVAAFLVQLLRSPQKVDHPDDAKDPSDPDFHLRVKPRGFIDTRAARSLDGNVESKSSVIQAVFTKEKAISNKNRSDLADQHEFVAMLDHVQKKLGELTDEIASGSVAVNPYMLGDLTPCMRCEYRSVCRFEPGINHYHTLRPIRRVDVLEKVVSPAGRQP